MFIDTCYISCASLEYGSGNLPFCIQTSSLPLRDRTFANDFKQNHGIWFGFNFIGPKPGLHNMVFGSLRLPTSFSVAKAVDLKPR